MEVSSIAGMDRLRLANGKRLKIEREGKRERERERGREGEREGEREREKRKWNDNGADELLPA